MILDPPPRWGGPTRAQPTPPPKALPSPKKDWTKIEAYRPDLHKRLS